VLEPFHWQIILAVYTLIAAGIPVWILLQPRDFINVFILYAGILLLAVGVVAGGIAGLQVRLPMLSIDAGEAELGLLWPFMFITVACGAISGFHALVAGGTVSKQVTSEPAARRIGFLGMLLESLFAVCVLAAIASGLSGEEYRTIVFPETGRGNPILAFGLGMSHLLHHGLGIPLAMGTIFGILMVEGFVATTLDTGVRLNRYLFEELWRIIFSNPPRIFKQFWFNSGLSVLLMLLFGLTSAFKHIWPLFGTANQLLAAFTLIVAATWMYIRKKKTWFLLVPAAFMTVTTTASLIHLARRYLVEGKMLLGGADLILILLTIGLVSLSVKIYFHLHSGKTVRETSA